MKTIKKNAITKINLFDQIAFCLCRNVITKTELEGRTNMSILLIRSFNGIRQNHQISSIVKLTTRSLGIRPFAQQKLKNDSTVATSSGGDRTDVSTDVRPLGERIKENTKTASYFGVIVFGIGVTGFIMFVVFRELFSSSSPNSVYSDALKECTNVNCSPFLKN